MDTAVLAFQNAPKKEKNFILQLIKKGVTDLDIETVFTFCKQYHGLQSAQDYVLKYANRAKEKIQQFQAGPAKDNALKFVDYIITRKK